MREAYDAGYDGWMEDFGEYTPPTAESADGTPGPQMHNRYPTDYHCAVQADRSAGTSGRCSPPALGLDRRGPLRDNVWGGDPTTVWGFDGLSSAVMQALGIGMSGVARWGSDIGGYHSFGPARCPRTQADPRAARSAGSSSARSRR